MLSEGISLERCPSGGDISATGLVSRERRLKRVVRIFFLEVGRAGTTVNLALFRSSSLSLRAREDRDLSLVPRSTLSGEGLGLLRAVLLRDSGDAIIVRRYESWEGFKSSGGATLRTGFVENLECYESSVEK